jgi:hypothetical protein
LRIDTLVINNRLNASLQHNIKFSLPSGKDYEYHNIQVINVQHTEENRILGSGQRQRKKTRTRQKIKRVFEATIPIGSEISMSAFSGSSTSSTLPLMTYL